MLGGRLSLNMSNLAEISGRPQQTVSQSEAGFEKIMQAVELRLGWTIPDDSCTLTLQLNIEPRP